LVRFGARAADVSRRHVPSRRVAVHREERAALATSIAVSSR